MTFFYDICRIKIRCEHDFEVNISPETKDFLTLPCQPDISFRFIPVSELTLPDINGTIRGVCRYFYCQTGYSIFWCFVGSDRPYACISWSIDNPGEVLCHYLPQAEAFLSTSKAVLDFLGLESVMLCHNALLLHAAFIRSKGRGILFTAPSGTGKSTQASLWEKYMGAEILNGDRSGVRKIGNSWCSFGLPYAGSSNIYRNESAPIHALVLLRQAKENRISRISSAEAMRFIYPEITVHRWDEGFVNKAVDLFLELCADVPVYLLECLPNEEAVQMLDEMLRLDRGAI